MYKSLKGVGLVLLTMSAHGIISQAAIIHSYSGNVEYTKTIGNGNKEANIVVDFDQNNYFMFKFKWDDTATGWNALDTISLGSLGVDATDWGDVWGVFVKDISYPGGTKYDYGAGARTGWTYYGSADNNQWEIDGNGVSFRNLSDGDWDSWVWTNYDENWVPIRTPGAAPVPEPMTLILLGIGGLILHRNRKSL